MLATTTPGFSSFEALVVTISIALIAFCYLLTLFNGYRNRP